VLGGHEVDVVAAFFLQGEHDVGQAVGFAGCARFFLADVPVLAENAVQVAAAEEDGPAAVTADQASLLARVGEGRTDSGMTAGAAEPDPFAQPVDLAPARACPAAAQRLDRGGHAPRQPSVHLRSQVRRREVLDHEISR